MLFKYVHFCLRTLFSKHVLTVYLLSTIPALTSTCFSRTLILIYLEILLHITTENRKYLYYLVFNDINYGSSCMTLMINSPPANAGDVRDTGSIVAFNIPLGEG